MPGLKRFILGLMCVACAQVAQATSVTLSASTTHTGAFQPIRFLVRVDGDRPTGGAYVSAGTGKTLCEITFNREYPHSGTCITTAALDGGQAQVVATFRGDERNAKADSAPVQITVDASALALKASDDPTGNQTKVGIGKNISFYLLQLSPVGTATFYMDGAPLCVDVPVAPQAYHGWAPAAVCVFVGQTAGMHRITAHYSGGANQASGDAIEYDIFVTGMIPDTERAALERLNANTAGVNIGYGLLSVARGDECARLSWVLCDDDGEHVIGLALAGHLNQGLLPDLSDLSRLENVDLSNNSLVGALPNLAALPRLKSLDVSNNAHNLSSIGYGIRFGLSGTLPDFSSASALIAFNAHGNQLTGTVPSLAGASRLETFDISSNQLSGALPPLTALAALRHFDASENQFDGTLPALDGLNALEVFDVHGNQFNGAIPSLSTLINLRTFIAYENQLTGALPDWSSLHHLQLFEVDENHLSGAIPPLAGLSELREFDISHNALSGTVPPLDGLNALQRFSIEYNQLNGPMPEPPSGAPLTAGASALCYNKLIQSVSPVWNSATGTSPWYADCQKSPVTIEASATPTPVAAGASVTVQFRIKATSGTATPTGKAGVFGLDAQPYCTVALVNGTGACQLNSLHGPGVANQWLVVVYGGDAQFAANGIAVHEFLSELVAGASSTRLYADVSAAYYGQPLPLTAFIRGGTGGGTVDFLEGDSAICANTSTVQINGAVFAHCNTSSLSVGTHSLTARYNGDTAAASSTSAPLGLVIGKIPTTTNINLARTQITVGESTTVTASLQFPASGRTPSGPIRIKAIPSSIGSEQPPSAGCNITPPQQSCSLVIPTAAYYQWYVSASYDGDAFFDGSSNTVGLNVVAIATTSSVSANPASAAEGDPITFTTLVSSPASGTVEISDEVGRPMCRSATTAGTPGQRAECASVALDPGTHTLTARYLSADPNYGSASANVTVSVTQRTTLNANQYGLGGAWYNPQTSGQGLVINVFPDTNAPGHGLLFAGWFTFAKGASGGTETQRWYTLLGDVNSTTLQTTLDIYASVGGNFNAPPKISAQHVGQATLTFRDCTVATLDYRFSDGSAGGSIPLTRLGPASVCTLSGKRTGYNPQNPPMRLTGTWYTPTTSGQGFLVNVVPNFSNGQIVNGHIMFGAWYTFAQNGQQTGGSTSQRWFTFQGNGDGGIQPDLAINFSAVPLYETTGGIFDDPAQVRTKPVGTVAFKVVDCNAANLEYSFSDGENRGLSGTIPLLRLGTSAGPCP